MIVLRKAQRAVPMGERGVRCAFSIYRNSSTEKKGLFFFHFKFSVKQNNETKRISPYSALSAPLAGEEEAERSIGVALDDEDLCFEERGREEETSAVTEARGSLPGDRGAAAAAATNPLPSLAAAPAPAVVAAAARAPASPRLLRRIRSAAAAAAVAVVAIEEEEERGIISTSEAAATAARASASSSSSSSLQSSPRSENSLTSSSPSPEPPAKP